ncbi:putative RNA methyltransferase [Micromonospora sp. NPDC002575]|uniref:putative RNA methyltransferase n=1 Tax=Micromonospora sp. NPDC002575 TaxID=3364222 RepID=UPI0036809E51
MDPRIVGRLRCPVCAEPLTEAATGTARALRCPRRHSFDVARQGYVDLLAGRAPHAGDTAEMVAARADFLAAGHYDPVSDALAAAARAALEDTFVADEARDGPAIGRPAVDGPAADGPVAGVPAPQALCSAPTDAAVTVGDRCACGCRANEAQAVSRPGARHAGAADAAGAAGAADADAAARAHGAVGAYPLVVDAGAGTGRHLAAVLAALPDAVGLALDVSKPALRRAARAHPRAAAALADTWRRLPLADGSVAVLLDVFAPRNGAEFHRVLHPAGVLLVVTPAKDHLAELVDALDLLKVDPDKTDRVAGSLAGHFGQATESVLRARLELTGPEVATLVGMGPSARHTDPAVLAARIAALPEPVGVTLAVRLGVYRPR